MEDYYIRGISFFCDIISQFQGWNFFFPASLTSPTDPPPQVWKRLVKKKKLGKPLDCETKKPTMSLAIT